MQEVLSCTDVPSSFCYSSADVDHEACLVRLEDAAIPPQEDASVPNDHPLVRALVGEDERRYPLRLHRKRPGRYEPRDEMMYVNGPGNLAVLYVIEARCFNIEEIT